MDIMTEELKLDELELLKQRADDMGVKYHPSISLDKLKAKIAESLEPVKPTNVNQSRAQKRNELRKECEKLVRVQIVNMNPSKREWKGEFFTASNSVVGTLTRFVPFDVEWHVPAFILKQIKNRKFRVTKEESNGKGGKISKNIFVPEFGVTELKPLTEKELKDLAATQAAKGSIDDD